MFLYLSVLSMVEEAFLLVLVEAVATLGEEPSDISGKGSDV
jgi:hypothetical protein